MGQCTKCKQYLPPDFLDEVKDPTNPNLPGQKVCHFCLRESEVVFGANDIVFKKDEVIHDYAIFIKRLSENKELRRKMSDKIVENAVSKMH